MVCENLGDLPMVYCAVNAVVNPSPSLSFNIRQWALDTQYRTLFTRSFQRYVSTLRNLHGISEVKSKIQEGDLSYPRSNSENTGMALELRNIRLPKSRKKKNINVLKDISLSIKAGQLVVIVGANGSGKSTIIKLFTSFYDPSSTTASLPGNTSHPTSVVPQLSHRTAQCSRYRCMRTSGCDIWNI